MSMQSQAQTHAYRGPTTIWTQSSLRAHTPDGNNWSSTKPPEPSVEPDLALHQSLPDFSGTFGTFSGTSLNLTRRLQQCTPELFWAEDPISLRCCRKNTKKTTKQLGALQRPWQLLYTSRTRTRRVAEVSSSKECYTIGVKDKVCL